MMNDDEVRRISQFFFLLLLNERMVLSSVSKATQKAELILKKNQNISRDQALVVATHEVCSGFSFQLSDYFQNRFSNWRFPEDSNLGPWKDFLSQQRRDEILCLLWYRVLKVSDVDIARALGIQLGTVRFRLARALKGIGSMVHEPSNVHEL